MPRQVSVTEMLPIPEEHAASSAGKTDEQEAKLGVTIEEPEVYRLSLLSSVSSPENTFIGDHETYADNKRSKKSTSKSHCHAKTCTRRRAKQLKTRKTLNNLRLGPSPNPSEFRGEGLPNRSNQLSALYYTFSQESSGSGSSWMSLDPEIHSRASTSPEVVDHSHCRRSLDPFLNVSYDREIGIESEMDNLGGST